MDDLMRMLQVVARELQADDVRLEIGLRPPGTDEVFCELSGGFRVVATFDRPVADLPNKRLRLQSLTETFATTFEAAVADAPHVEVTPKLASQALDDALGVLARAAGADVAAVIDRRSPMIWGTSLSLRGREDVAMATEVAAASRSAAEAGIELAELLSLGDATLAAALSDAGVGAEARHRIIRSLSGLRASGPSRDLDEARRFVATMVAIAELRALVDEEPDAELRGFDSARPWIARGFNGIYLVVLVFSGPFSELHAEAAMHRGLPVIENMVAALPPVDPTPGGGRRGEVLPLFRPRR